MVENSALHIHIGQQVDNSGRHIQPEEAAGTRSDLTNSILDMISLTTVQPVGGAQLGHVICGSQVVGGGQMVGGEQLGQVICGS